MATSLDVGYSTLEKWITKSLTRGLEGKAMTKEKRPQDWSYEEKLEIVIACAPLEEQAISELCREKGIYPHHVNSGKRTLSAAIV